MAEAGLSRHDLRRHDLVDPDPTAWARLLDTRPDLAGLPHLADWVKEHRPLVVRRYHPGEAHDRVPLGLPLPPEAGKRRIGLGLPPASVSRREPLSLRAVREVAPEPWRETIEALDALAIRCGVACRPFGALLWQALTGLPYLTAASDIDLIWSAPASPRTLLAGIARVAADAPMRIDGEVVLADGAGRHWREWYEAAPGGTVLAKHIDRLEMRAAASLTGGLAA